MSSAYHPQTQGAIERFHQTLKTMLKKYYIDHQKEWDKGVQLMLFAVREAVQESTGFSPFELVFGHTVRGPLKLLQEEWLSTDSAETSVSFLVKFKSRLNKAFNIVKENMTQAQTRMKVWYDRKARNRFFAPGDRVLILLPVPGQSLSVKYFGPYKIDSGVNEVNYVVKTLDRRKKKLVCHINMIKPYFSWDDRAKQNMPTVPVTPIVVVNKKGVDSKGPMVVVVKDEEDNKDPTEGKFTGCKLKNSTVLEKFDEKLGHLTISEKDMIKEVIKDFPNLVKDTPGKTWLIKQILKWKTRLRSNSTRIGLIQFIWKCREKN